MKLSRRSLLVLAPALVVSGPQAASAAAVPPAEILHGWYGLMLELVRHTPIYSPPVASRNFAYMGIACFEAIASGSTAMQTLAGQLHGLTPVPSREKGKAHAEGAVLNTVLVTIAEALFDHTGPTGQRAMAAMKKKMAVMASHGIKRDVLKRSEAHGVAVARHILDWASTDGGAVIENMGFPQDYKLNSGPAHWVPTSAIALQQTPLLPDWGNNRTFAMPVGTSCGLPPPPAYSEDKNSEFYKQAIEVCETVRRLTPEQKAIARSWADDPMLSTTPPGHWIEIALALFDRDNLPLDKRVDVLARLGIGLADAFIGCWADKYKYDLVRPVTYIKRVIDPKWEPLLITPPFPEYPSGHSTQSGAAEVILTAAFGENFAFDDSTRSRDGLKTRNFKSFREAAEEAGISRLYGGIHFRAAIERGLEQGRCIGAFTNALKTRVAS